MKRSIHTRTLRLLAVAGTLGASSSFQIATAAGIAGLLSLATPALGPVGHALQDQEVHLMRYNADGTLDSTFGAGGEVITRVPTSTNDVAFAAAPAWGGKVVVGGESVINGSWPWIADRGVATWTRRGRSRSCCRR
jgi:hypothetical protein